MIQDPERFLADRGMLAVSPDAKPASPPSGKDPPMIRHVARYNLPANPPTPSFCAQRPSRQIGLALAFGCGLVLPNIAHAQSIAQTQNPVPMPLARDSQGWDGQGFDGSSAAVPARGVRPGLSVPSFYNVAFVTAPDASQNARAPHTDPLQPSEFVPIAIAPLPVLPPATALQARATPIGVSAVPALNPIPGFLQKKRLRKAVKRLYAKWTQKGTANKENTPGGALQSAAAAAIASPSAAARISAPSATSIANNPREQRVLIASGTVTTTTLGSSQSQSATTNPAPQNISREAVTRSTPLPVPPPLTQTEAPPVQPRTLAYVEQIRDVLRAQAQNPVAARSPTPAPLAPNVQPASVTGLNPAGTNPAGAEGNLADARSLEQTIANENALVALFSRGSVGARSVGVSPK